MHPKNWPGAKGLRFYLSVLLILGMAWSSLPPQVAAAGGPARALAASRTPTRTATPDCGQFVFTSGPLQTTQYGLPRLNYTLRNKTSRDTYLQGVTFWWDAYRQANPMQKIADFHYNGTRLAVWNSPASPVSWTLSGLPNSIHRLGAYGSGAFNFDFSSRDTAWPGIIPANSFGLTVRLGNGCTVTLAAKPTTTPTPTASWTPSPSATPTDTPTDTATLTPSATPTDTPTFTPSDTSTATSSNTSSQTFTKTPTRTWTPSATRPSPSLTRTWTATRTKTATASDTLSDTPTFTPTDTATASDTPSNTPTFSPTPLPSSTSTPSLTPTAEPVTPPYFLPYVTYLPSGARELAIGDFNTDGLLDVAVATDVYPAQLLVYLQTGDGNLAAPVSYDPGANSYSMAAGDLNNDGRTDLVIADVSGNSIVIFLQQPDGTLGNRVTYATGSQPDAVAIGDVNGDSLPDVVVSHWSSPYIGIFTQNQSGSLNPMVTYPAPQAGWDDIAVGDVNGDGLNDVVKMNGQGLNPNLSVFLQQGNGVLAPAASYSLLGCKYSCLGSGVAVGDVTGDGRADVVMSYGGNRPGSNIAVFAQGTDGLLQTPVSYPAYDIPQPVKLADINGDGRLDVVTAHGGWDALSVFLQGSNGTLQAYTTYSLPYASNYRPEGMAVGDVNHDGKLDVAVADYNNGLVVLYQSVPPPPTPTRAPTFTPTASLSPTITLTPTTSLTRTPSPTTVSLALVTNTNDGGPGSLRQALLDVAWDGTVAFDPSLAGQTILVGSTLLITKDMTIDGSGLGSHVAVSGGGIMRVFKVSFGATVTIQSIDVVDGFAADPDRGGGGIDNAGQLTLSDVQFLGNRAPYLDAPTGPYGARGGAIYSTGNVRISNSNFHGNSADFRRGHLHKRVLLLASCGSRYLRG